MGHLVGEYGNAAKARLENVSHANESCYRMSERMNVYPLLRRKTETSYICARRPFIYPLPSNEAQEVPRHNEQS